MQSHSNSLIPSLFIWIKQVPPLKQIFDGHFSLWVGNSNELISDNKMWVFGVEEDDCWVNTSTKNIFKKGKI